MIGFRRETCGGLRAIGCICNMVVGTGDRVRRRTTKLGCPVHDSVPEPEPEPVRQLYIDTVTIDDPERGGSEPGSWAEEFARLGVDDVAAPVADPVPVAFAPRLNPDRLFAVYQPKTERIAVFFDNGMLEMELAEARTVAGALSGALAIAEGHHAVQGGGA